MFVYIYLTIRIYYYMRVYTFVSYSYRYSVRYFPTHLLTYSPVGAAAQYSKCSSIVVTTIQINCIDSIYHTT